MKKFLLTLGFICFWAGIALAQSQTSPGSRPHRGQGQANAGSISAPSFTFGPAANGTGFSSPAAGQFAISVNGLSKWDYGVTNTGSLAGGWTYSEPNGSSANLYLISNSASGFAKILAENSSGSFGFLSMYGSSFSISNLQNKFVALSTTGMAIGTDSLVASGGADAVFVLSGGYSAETAAFMPSGMLVIGAGITASYPGLINSTGTTLAARLADNSADAPFTASNVSTSLGFLNTSAVPVLSTCGSTTNGSVAAGSTNARGNITFGTVAPTACTATFANAYPNYAFCTISAANAAAAASTTQAYISSSSKTAFTITIAAGTTPSFNYTCIGG